jgi:hypothetical protein
MTDVLGPDQAIVPNPDVIVQAMPSGAVLVDRATGECFELNRVGAEIWGELQRGAPPAQIVDRLAARYAIAPAQLGADLRQLLEQLARHGIVKLAASR